MSLLQQQLESTAQWVAEQLAQYERVDEGHNYPWPNHVWTAEHFRRAHLDVVDARETHKLYMLHLTVFPNTNDPSPVFGFDVIAGPTKVTGLFHDYSPIAGGTALDRWFGLRVGKTAWSKQRELPEWARAIFSGNMVAAGNIQDPDELAQLLDHLFDDLVVPAGDDGDAGDGGVKGLADAQALDVEAAAGKKAGDPRQDAELVLDGDGDRMLHPLLLPPAEKIRD